MEVLDSKAEMISNGRPVALSFITKCNIDPGAPGFPAEYYLDQNPHRAILTYFSGADEKDLAFVRRCLKETRFKKA